MTQLKKIKQKLEMESNICVDIDARELCFGVCFYISPAYVLCMHFLQVCVCACLHVCAQSVYVLVCMCVHRVCA